MANIQTIRPKREFRKTAPVECEFEIGGKVVSLPLKLTHQSWNEIARSEHAGAIAKIFGRANPDQIGEALSVWETFTVVGAVLHAATAHIAEDERPSFDEISGSISAGNIDYYNEVFALLSGTGGSDERPTNAGGPAEKEAASSTSTGAEPSQKPDISTASANQSLPN